MANTGTLRGRDQESYLEVSLTGLTALTLDTTQAIKKILRFTGTLNADATVRDAVTIIPIEVTDPQPGDTFIFIEEGDQITIVNQPAAPSGGQLVLTINASVVLTAEQAANTNIELRAGTIDEPFSVTWPAMNPPDFADGRTWVVENTTGQPCTLIGDDGSQSFLVNNARCQVLWDGTTLTRQWLSTPTHFNFAGADPIDFDTWDQVDADYIEFSPVAGDVTVNWPNGGSLGKRGRRQTIKNDDTNNWLDVKTSGAGADKTTRLLPGETCSFVIDDSGAIVPDWTRAFERRVSIAHDDSATYTVVHPDFLARVLVITGTLTVTRNLVLPTVNHKSWIVQNSTDESLVVKTAAGTGVTLLSGKTQAVACDGTDILPLSLPAGGTERFWERADGQIFIGTTPTADAEGVVLGNLLAPSNVRLKAHLSIDDGIDIITQNGAGTRYGTGSSAKQAFWGNTARSRGAVTGATTEALLDNLLTYLSSIGIIDPFVSPLSVSPWLFIDPRNFAGAHDDPVGTLTDTSGNSRSPTAAGGVRGLLQVSSNLSPNGSRTVLLDGTDDSYDHTTSMFSMTAGAMYTIAGNFTTNAGAGQVIFTDSGNQRPQLIVETVTTNLYAFRDEGHTITFGGFSGGWQVLQWVFRPPSGGTGLAELWKNGALLTPSGSPTWNWNPASSTGFIVSGGPLPAKVALGPVIVTPGDVSDLTREGIRAWISAHYGPP
jgi:hypothetical protein